MDLGSGCQWRGYWVDSIEGNRCMQKHQRGSWGLILDIRGSNLFIGWRSSYPSSNVQARTCVKKDVTLEGRWWEAACSGRHTSQVWTHVAVNDPVIEIGYHWVQLLASKKGVDVCRSKLDDCSVVFHYDRQIPWLARVHFGEGSKPFNAPKNGRRQGKKPQQLFDSPGFHRSWLKGVLSRPAVVDKRLTPVFAFLAACREAKAERKGEFGICSTLW